jgi:phosphatidylglycerophosphatase A
VPAGGAGAAVAFALFRILDIAKPPPVSWCEAVPGGPGVMLDDVIAGVLAALMGAAAFAAWPALAG